MTRTQMGSGRSQGTAHVVSAETPRAARYAFVSAVAQRVPLAICPVTRPATGAKESGVAAA